MKDNIQTGILKTNIEIIKYNGNNKDFIIKYLNIVDHVPYYLNDNMIGKYFIIPFNKADWFILDEEQYISKIELINDNNKTT